MIDREEPKSGFEEAAELPPEEAEALAKRIRFTIEKTHPQAGDLLILRAPKDDLVDLVFAYKGIKPEIDKRFPGVTFIAMHSERRLEHLEEADLKANGLVRARKACALLREMLKDLMEARDWDDHDEQVKSYRARFAAFLGESDEGTELRGPCSRGGG